MSDKFFETTIITKIPLDGEDRLRFNRDAENKNQFCLGKDKEIKVKLKIISEVEYEKQFGMAYAFILHDDCPQFYALNDYEKKHKQKKYEFLTNLEIEQRFIKVTDPRLKKN